MKVYDNGEVINKESLADVFEPGFLFGWGIFEVLRAYKGKIPFLNSHIERLDRSLTLLEIGEVDLDWQSIIHNLLVENGLEDAYIRITAYKKRQGVGMLMYVDKFEYYKEDTYKKGFDATVSSHRRCSKNICSQVKSLSYLPNRLAWFGAQKKKKSEALILNPKGVLAGGSRSNLFLIKDNKVITPSIEDGAFCGITRGLVINILEKLNIDLKEGEASLEDLFNCREAFITSSLMEVMPLVECDDKLLGQGMPGEVTLKILEEYRKLLN
ncbi:MAG: aminotransferase class IV [Candidatus Omnitrophica bacterium]|nr:aminotransferase class IV [Candidatus Omnitrophota bacterium]